MTFATSNRLDRCRFAALSIVALIALSAGCSDDGGTTGSGGSGGTGATGGAGGAGGSGATGGSTGGAGGTGPTVTDGGLCATSDAPVGSGGAGGAGGSGGSSGTGGTVYGSFIVSLKNDKPPAFTQFIGRVYDGPQAPSLVLKVDSQEAGCQLLVPKAAFCSPPCNMVYPTNGGVCIDDNMCMPNPGAVTAGVAHVTGMKGGELTMTPSAPAYVYQPTMTLPANACDEGADIKVTTDKFTAQTKCIAPFELSCGPTEKVSVKSGQPVRLSWKKPADPTASRVEIVLDIAHHGGKKGEIDCDVPDTGSFDIPATLTTKLVALGLAGFPTIVVRRVSKASPSNEPGMKIQIDADVEREVDTGVVSCTEDKDCPTGQTCQRDLSCK
jgi:hypothetical protein